MLTGGQSKFEFMNDSSTANIIKKDTANNLSFEGINLVRLKSNDEYDQRHSKRLSEISEKYSIDTIWSKH